MTTVRKRLEALEAITRGAKCSHCGRDNARRTVEVRVIEARDDWQPCPACWQPVRISPNFGERPLK